MTRNDYRAIAEHLRNTSPRVRKANGDYPFDVASDLYYAQTLQWERDVRALATVMAADNLRFSYERFYRAVGYSIRSDGSLYPSLADQYVRDILSAD